MRPCSELDHKAIKKLMIKFIIYDAGMRSCPHDGKSLERGLGEFNNIIQEGKSKQPHSHACMHVVIVPLWQLLLQHATAICSRLAPLNHFKQYNVYKYATLMM